MDVSWNKNLIKIVIAAHALLLTSCSLVASMTELVSPSAEARFKVSLDITSLTLSEGSSALINVTLSERRDTPTVVDVSLSSVRNDTAADFMPVVSSVTIPANSLSAPLLLTSVQDNIYETDEAFSLFLYTTEDSVAVERPYTTVTILDDDPMPVVNFALASQNINEGAGTGTITVQLSHPSAFDIVVPYTVSNGTASNADYTLANGTVTFTAGQLSKNISFAVNDDAISETTETFTAQLTAGTSAVVLGTTTSHTVNIIDNEATNLTINDVSVTEGGNLVFTVTLSVASLSVVTFDWATSAGSAVNGVDYVDATGFESVPAGTLTTTITIPTVNTSAVCEADRTITVTLSNPGNATIADGTGIGTITDDDLPSISVANNSGPESGVVAITATLSAACPTKTVSFKWSNSAGTATAGTDYGVITNQSVSISAGSTSAVLNTTPVNDAIHEANETFTVTLSNLVNATAGTLTATGTILDDDEAFPVMLREFNKSPASTNFMKMADARVIFNNGDTVHGTEPWITDGTAAGTFMLKDVNPGLDAGVSTLFGVNPTSNIGYFLGKTPTEGSEIWRTDGTSAGTYILKDIVSGTGSPRYPELVGHLGTLTFFSTYDDFYGYYHLWVTDGSSSGTTDITGSFLFDELNPGIVMGGSLYFGAATYNEGSGLWKTDGTIAGTTVFKAVSPAPSYNQAPYGFTQMNSKVLFFGETDANGIEPWVSDGTAAGTILLKDIWAGASNSNTSFVGNAPTFSLLRASDGANKIWVTNGTPAGTTGLSVSSTFVSGSMGTISGKIVFVGNNTASGYEPWVTDGTLAGTFMLKDINSGTSSGASTMWSAVVNNRVVFTANDATLGQEMWVTDGTSAGTTLLKDIYPGAEPSNPENLFVVGNKVVFTATSPNGRELWITDGTSAGTTQLFDIAPGSDSSSPLNLAVLDTNHFFFTAVNPAVNAPTVFMGDLTSTPTATGIDAAVVPSYGSSTAGFAALGSTDVFFDAVNSGPGNTIWKTDGTSAGTSKITDIFPSLGCTDVGSITTVGSSVFFSASSNGTGTEVWKTDGTSAGTVLTKDIYSGTSSGYVSSMTALDSTRAIFTGSDATNGYEPWITDGTSAGTVLLKDTYAGTNSASPSAYVINSTQGRAYFSSTAASSKKTVWSTDGTPAGTVQISPFGTIERADFYQGATKTYIASGSSMFSNDRLLWVSNGTSAGTVQISPASSYLDNTWNSQVVTVGDGLFYIGRTAAAGSELWYSDGTLAGTHLVKDIVAGSGTPNWGAVKKFGSRVIFGADGNTWISDGTSAGTVMFDPGRAFGNGVTSIEFAGKLFFERYDSTNGSEPWVTDGTLAGTSLLKDINPGTFASGFSNLIQFNSKLYFTANDGVHGNELWVTDGTSAGTKMVLDINEGMASSNPTSLKVVNGKLYFIATTLMSGDEVWVLEP